MCRVYGYCRVSTMKQSIERQIRNVKEKYPEAVIITEKYTGTKLDRPEWTKLYKQLKSGDTVVFDEVSRMSRNADEGFEVYEKLFNNDVNLIFLKEPHINTSVFQETKKRQLSLQIESGNKSFDKFGKNIIDAFNELLLDLAKEQIRLAFDQAEKEVEDLHQRTREGIETARLNGKQIGQRKGAKLTTKKSEALKKLIVKYSRDFEGKNTDDEVMSIINGMDKIVYDVKTVKNPETGEKEKKELLINPHDGITESGSTKNRFINRGTYYKYKRELKSGI